MDDEEQFVVHRLRQLTGVVLALSGLAIALGYLDLHALDMEYRPVIVRAGTDALTVLAMALVVPAVWVYRMPRMPQIVIWCMWFVSVAMFAVIFMVGQTGRVFGTQGLETIDEMWVRPLIVLLHVTNAFVVLILMPILRSTHKSPPLPKPTKLPAARIVR